MSHLPALRRYAVSLTRSTTDAEDLVHDTLVRALERDASFRPDGNLRGWLMSILHNLYVDKRRSDTSAAGRDRNRIAGRLHEAIGPVGAGVEAVARVETSVEAGPGEHRNRREHRRRGATRQIGRRGGAGQERRAGQEG